MPIYDVTMYFHGHHKVTIEAKDEERAEEEALFDINESMEVAHFEVNDVMVVKSDDQYTDQQELLDREGPGG